VTAAATGGGAEPFDLDAAMEAVLADSAPFPFTYKGNTYTVPAQVTWPIDALSALARGELDKTLDTLLGEEAFQKLTADGITVGALNALFEEMAKQAGMGSLPNSPKRPSRGSRRT
jgi:hypothetical protein